MTPRLIRATGLGTNASDLNAGRSRRTLRRIAILSAAISLAQVGAAQAQLYWDVNSGSDGAGGPSPSGSWDSSSSNWNTSSDGTGSTTLWSPNSDAIFSAGSDATGAFTITLVGTQTANSVNVQLGTPTFMGDELDFSGSANATVNDGLTATFSNVIGGGSGFTKQGNGTVLLGNTANVYTGDTNINGGVIVIAANGALGNTAGNLNFSSGTLALSGNVTSARTVNFNGDGTIDTGASNNGTFTGDIHGGGSINKIGGGSVTLSGTGSDFGGQLNILNGAVVTTATNGLGSNGGSTVVSPGAALIVNNTITIAEPIHISGTGLANNGAIHKINTGNTTLSGGITLDADARIQNDSGVLTISGTGITGSNASITLGGNGSFSVTGAIATGDGFVIKTGTGVATLSATNTFDLGVIVNGGTLSNVGESTGVAGAGTNTGKIPASPIAKYITLNGATLRETGTGSAHTFLNKNKGIFVTGTGGALEVTDAATVVHIYDGNISGDGTAGLTKVGIGMLSCTGTETYLGNTTVTAGTLKIRTNSNIFPDASQLFVAGAGTFAIDGLAETMGALSGSGTVQISGANSAQGGAGTFGDANNTTYSGIVTGGTSSTFTKKGAGTMTISTLAWQENGTVSIAAGAIKIGDANTGFGSGIGTVTIGAAGTWDMNNFPQSIGNLAGAGAVTNGANLTLTGTAGPTFSGTFNGGAGTTITKTAASTGTATFSGSNTFGGGVFLSGGRMNFNNNNAAGTGNIAVDATAGGVVAIGESSGSVALPNNINLTPGGGTIDFLVTGTTLTLNGIVSGNSGLTKGLGGGAGTLTLTNVNNSFTGPIVINAGTLSVAADAILGPNTNNITIGGLANETANAVFAASQTFALDPARTLTLNSTNIGSCEVSVAANQTLTYNGTIGGPGSLTKVNSGTLVLGGNNTQAAGIAINGGAVSITNNNNLGPAGSSISFSGGTLATANDLVLDVTRPLVFNGTANFNPAAATTLTVGQDITGVGGPTKVGTGTVILTGSNAFTGFTAVNGGVLSVSNDNNLGAATSVTFNGGTMLTTAAITSSKQLSVVATGVGTLDTGAFNSTFGNLTGGASTTMHKQGTGVLTVNSARLTSLSVDTGTLAIAAGRDAINKSSKVATLTIAGGAAMDLDANDLIVDYSNGGVADPAQSSAVRAQILTAYAGGAWTGKGLTSAAAKAAATSGHPTALGYSEASAAGYTSGTYDGFNVDGDMVIVRYTYSGDSNLDGMVDTSDFMAMANHFGATGQNWVAGDFNYDGVVNALDFNAVATNFGAATLTAPPVLGALVPEPGTLAVVSAAGFAFASRRRRGR